MKDDVIIHPSPPIATSSLLVVDDNSMNRIMLSRYIAKLGYRSSLAENGRQALEKLQAEPCDLVLLDVQMPEDEVDLEGCQIGIEQITVVDSVPNSSPKSKDECCPYRRVGSPCKNGMPTPTLFAVEQRKCYHTMQKTRQEPLEKPYEGSCHQKAW